MGSFLFSKGKALKLIMVRRVTYPVNNSTSKMPKLHKSAENE